MKKKTLVFGASIKPNRYSNYAIQRLVANDYEVFAYGIKGGTISGIIVDTTLKPYENIDTVTLYLNAKRQKEYYNYIIGLKPKRIIFNPGTENPEFYNILDKHHIFFEEACTLVLLSTNQY